jgi:mannose-6-phosphate isomerase-like protein (cupin superfamily)
MQPSVRGVLCSGNLHVRVEEIKHARGTPPWLERVLVNDHIVATLICQPPGHPTDRHYRLVDEWWFVVEGEIDWEIEGHPEPVRARAGDLVFVPARHFHHIRPKGSGPSIRLAILPPGEVHRHERGPGERPTGSGFA